MAELKKHVGLKADEEEIAQIELIKKHYGLKQDGAVIRFVVNQEAKKILSLNISRDIKRDEAETRQK